MVNGTTSLWRRKPFPINDSPLTISEKLSSALFGCGGTDKLPDEILKIAVIGAGAIGGVTGARMTKAGWNVDIVCKHDAAVRAGIDGFRIFGVGGEDIVPVRAVKTVADLPDRPDVVLLATKANDAVAAAEAVKPQLQSDSAVVSLQNGICEDAIAQVVGPEKTVGCVVAWGATLHEPGKMEVTSEGEFVVGKLDGSTDPRLHLVRKMLSAAAPARISDNIYGELFSKLIVNACINSLGAIAGVPLGRLLASKLARDLIIGVMAEAMNVAHAAGISVPPGAGGKLDYDRFLAGSGAVSTLRRHLMLRMIGFKYRRIRSSSLQSLERGRPTEVDFLNGYICKKGSEHGVPTPVNRAIVNMISEIEKGGRSSRPSNLNDPVFPR
jgi:2-dehydropantoate 2-reductase